MGRDFLPISNLYLTNIPEAVLCTGCCAAGVLEPRLEQADPMPASSELTFTTSRSQASQHISVTACQSVASAGEIRRVRGGKCNPQGRAVPGWSDRAELECAVGCTGGEARRLAGVLERREGG